MDRELYILIIPITVIIIIFTIFFILSKRSGKNKYPERRMSDRRLNNYERRVQNAFDEMEYIEEKRNIERRSDERRKSDQEPEN